LKNSLKFKIMKMEAETQRYYDKMFFS